MRLYRSFFILLLLGIGCIPGVSYAQPRYSPEVRAENEARWMKDSLHLTPEKLKKAGSISLVYNRKMDSINDATVKSKDKVLKKLADKKDADIKRLMSKADYQRYIRREKLIRRMDKVKYEGRHQPY